MRGTSQAAARKASCAHECSNPTNASTPLSFISVIRLMASEVSGRPVSPVMKHRLYPGRRLGSLIIVFYELYE